MKTVKVGLVGVGTVGRGVVEVLQRNCEEISRRTGSQIVVVAACARDVEKATEFLGPEVKVFNDPLDVVRDDNVDIVIELIGGTTTARTLLLEAISLSKPVVTANKALIAECGNELFAQAAANGSIVAYEAAVAGGIPIIKALREGLAGNRIDSVAGIVNGTTNFILSEMREKGMSFEEALGDAQRLGYAEADPTFDIEGIDAGQKLAIIAAVSFGISIQPEKVYCEGITKLTEADILAAEEFGYRVKLLAITKRRTDGFEMRVHPTLVPDKCVIASVDGPMNAVLVHGDAVGPTLYYGAGAGAEPTASAVISDLIDVIRLQRANAAAYVPHLAFQREHLSDVPILDMGEVESSFYLRIRVRDEPGVLSDIAGILAEYAVSIEAMRQRESNSNDEGVDIVIFTHKTKESSINDASKKISALEAIYNAPARLRIEMF
ncbi:MAG: homoserine dehydrogenase [Burkholderiales bacterium]|nr:homoserine dehydrogenase [Burkholderiales bacterium]OUT78464.1 MAG: homoserine dehydrogenase [Betaproteobacteria bacterium TMED22]|tara:strand:- start:16172 stop:17479 length:1308 start_codon:yes stop_codon:yes gene_type:complete